ncbi:hypothetical protein CHL67_04830 [Prosthecochloris sp. GSB1]|nr:hypothetical protein CHL67_04830 [Prosthecochloris sp. GSB1]
MAKHDIYHKTHGSKRKKAYIRLDLTGTRAISTDPFYDTSAFCNLRPPVAIQQKFHVKHTESI